MLDTPLIPPDPSAEALLAVLDIDTLLETGARIRFTSAQRVRAHGLVQVAPDGTISGAIRDRVRRFLASKEPPTESTPPDFDYRRALDLLTELDPEQRIQELEGAGGDVAGLVVAAGKIVTYLKEILPRRARVTYAGPKSVEPSDLVRYRFRRAYAVAQNPMQVFEHLIEGDMARDEVRALQAMYPSLLDAGQKAMFQELARLKGDRPNLEIPRAKARMVENLLLTRAWSQELAQKMQAAFKQKDEDAGPKGKLLDSAGSDPNETPVQRVANK